MTERLPDDRPFRPAFLPDALSQPSPEFAWRGAGRHGGPANAVTPLLEKLDMLTNCGQITLCAGVLAWAAARLEGSTTLGASALELAQAAFAFQIDGRYVDRDAGDVHKPVDEPPAQSALMEVMSYQRTALNREKYLKGYYAPIMQTFHASHITQRVMGPEHRPAFVAWFEQAIERVQRFARRPSEPFRQKREFPTYEAYLAFIAPHRGPALPPELLDPAVPYAAQDREALVAAFVATLDWRRNRYLRAPDAMRALGFVGTPYPHLEDPA